MRATQIFICTLMLSLVAAGCANRDTSRNINIIDENFICSNYLNENNSIIPELPTHEPPVTTESRPLIDQPAPELIAEPCSIIEQISALDWSDPVFKALIVEALTGLDDTYGSRDIGFELHLMLPDGLASVTHLSFDAGQPWMYEPGFEQPVFITVRINEYWWNVETHSDFFQSSFLETIDDIIKFPNLQSLDLAWVAVGCIKPLAELEHLERLRIILLPNLLDISPISRLPNLRNLWFSDKLRINETREFVDYSPLYEVTQLEVLALAHVGIQDYSFLTYFQNLRELTILRSEVEDISFLDEMHNIKSLFLIGNNIVDISPLSNLINLTNLDISHNLIYDITPLSCLLNLTNLDLSHNLIHDIYTLSGLANLSELDISNNNITDILVLSDLTKLINLRVDWYHFDDLMTLRLMLPNLR